MNNLFKVILLCAILSNTFTPCFSADLSINAANEIAHLPLAGVPVDRNKNNISEDGLKMETPYIEQNESDNNIENVPADVTDYLEDASKSVCPLDNNLIPQVGTIENFKSAYKCLAGKELSAIMLEKGRTFEVKSMQAMSYESVGGTEVKFESLYPERVLLDKAPQKLVFTGEIIKNKPPRKGGGTGTLKVMIKNVKFENITYPAEAYITKMNKKGVFFGAVAGPSNYKNNLTDTANNGTIHTIYKDPCKTTADECVHAAAKPFYFLTGALLQTADLFISPIVAFFIPGNEVYIPEGTEFEIKLENDIPILEI